MKYSEYLTSAKRHDYTCEMLQEILMKDEVIDEQKTKFLYLNMYYLAGYIFECGIKYKILEVCCHADNIDVCKSSCSGFNFKFHDDFKIHNLERLFELYDVLGGGRYDIKASVSDLFNDWSPDIRYEDIACTVENIFDFYTESKRFLYRG